MKDDYKHLIAGAVIAAVTCTAGIFLGFHVHWGFVTVTLAAFGKELIWDKWLGRGTPEVADIVATLAGGFLVSFGFILFSAFVLGKI